jgi:AcrR family transcriptional regulator
VPVDQPAASSLPVGELPAHQAMRRQRIVDAARSLLEEQEYEQIQIRDVAATAGVALGTLYRYFSSKDHLYAAVLLAWGAGFTKPGGRRKADTDPWRRLQTRIRGALAAFEKRPQFFRLLMLLLGSNDPNANAVMDQFREFLENTVQADLAELDPEGAQDYSVLIWAVMNSVLTRSIFHERPMAEARRINDRFLDLLRLRYGH